MPDLGKEIFNINIPTIQPDCGRVLVSEPFLREDYFRHSVVFLVDHEFEGKSMGIVMNHPIGYTLSDVIDDFDEGCRVPLYRGGPMSPDRLFYIHRLGEYIADSSEIAAGIWIGGDFEQVKRYVADEDNPTEGVIRFFLGYSGWESMQLSSELMEHVWAVSDNFTPKMILSGHGDAFWHKFVRTLGPSHRSWLLHPEDLAAN